MDGIEQTEPADRETSRLPIEEATAPPAGEAGLADLSEAAAGRIRRFIADGMVKGGASPADVADLYMSAEVMADEGATAYLDRRYVRSEVPPDWRKLEDDLAAAHVGSPVDISGEELLGRLEASQQAPKRERSIFDDPDEDEDWDEDRAERMIGRDPTLTDLSPESRRAVERHLVAEVFEYGVAPIRTMQLREKLYAAGDERALQYLDLPFEHAERPADWDALRDQALRLRARLEARRDDPAEVFAKLEAAHPELEMSGLLRLLEDRLQRS